MTTKLKSETARANGARSRGPITPEGKNISAQNSTRHGMLAQTIVLDGESHDLFHQLVTSLAAEIQPRTPIEAAIVETMAVARWRQMRTWAIQKAGFDFEMSRPENSGGGRPTRFALVFRNLADNSRLLDLIHRYETAFDRQFSGALSLLLKLRSSPLAEAAAPEDLPFFPGPSLTWQPDPTELSNTNLPNEPSGAELHPPEQLTSPPKPSVPES